MIVKFIWITRLFVCPILVLLLISPVCSFAEEVFVSGGTDNGTMPGQGGVQLSRASASPIWFGDDENFTDWRLTLRNGSTTARDLALGDVNSDGRLDVIASTSSRMYVHYGEAVTLNQWASFNGIQTSYSGTLTGSVDVGDLNGDGNLGVIMTFANAAGYTAISEHAGYLPRGVPNWQFMGFPPGSGASPGTDADRRVSSFVDIDQDGDTDLIIGIVSNATNTPGYQQFENIGGPLSPIWSPVTDNRWNLDQITNSYNTGIPRLDFGDIDADGDPDLLAYGCIDTDCRLRVFSNDGGGTSWTLMADWDVASDFSVFRLGDVDGDGDADIMYVANNRYNSIRNDAAVSFSTSPGTFTSNILDASTFHLGYTAINFDTTVPVGTTLSIQVRSGNTATPDAGWTDWSADLAPGDDITVTVETDSFIQYRAALSSSSSAFSPVLRNVSFIFSDEPPPTPAPQIPGSFFQTDWSDDDTECLPVEIGFLFQCNASAENNQTGWVGLDRGWQGGTTNLIDFNVTDSLILAAGDGTAVDTTQAQVLGTYSSTMSTKTGVRLFSTPSDPDWFGDDETNGEWLISGNAFDERAIAVGDMDNDGLPDVLLYTIGSTFGGNVYFSRGPVIRGWNMEDTNDSWQLFRYSIGLALGDLNDDGLLDVISVKSDGSISTLLMDRLVPGDAPRWVLSGWDSPTGGSPGVDTDRMRPSLVDLDQDGDLDLIINLASSPGNAPGYQQFENIGTPKEPVWQAFDVSVDRWNLNQTVNNYTTGEPQLSFGDVDGDGDPDMLASNACLETGCELYLFRNNGGGVSWTLMNDWGMAERPSSAAYQLSETPYFRLADIDGDSDSDVLYLGHAITGRFLRVVRNDAVAEFSSSGTFMSQVIDMGAHEGFSSFDYNANVPSNTTLSLRIRSGNTPDLSAIAWSSNVSNGGDISAQGTNRYIQYEVQMSTTDSTISPTLVSVSFNHGSVPATSPSNSFNNPAAVRSSFFNTTGQLSTIDSISWNESLTQAGQDIRIQIQTMRGSGAAGTAEVPTTNPSTGWIGPDGTTGSYWNSNNDFAGACAKVGSEVTCALMPDVVRDGDADQWFMYKVELVSEGGASPILYDIRVGFTIRDYLNEAPLVNIISPATWTMSTEENKEFRFFVTVSDVNESKVSFRLSGGEDVAAFSLEDGSMETEFERPWLMTPSRIGIVLLETPDFEFPIDAGADNTYNLEMTVTELGEDGLLSAQTFNLEIQNVNEGPIITGQSALTNDDGLVYFSVNENTTAVTWVTSEDIDSASAPTYLIFGGADRSKFTMDVNTGQLNFIDPPDYESPTDFGENNRYDVQIAAVDSVTPNRISLQNFVVTVLDVDDDLPPGPGDVSSGSETESGVNFIVNSNLDAVDLFLGDGICASALPQNPCTLRAAVQETNASKNSFADGEELPDIITFVNSAVPVTYLLSVYGPFEDLSATGDLDITESLTITGNTSDMGRVIINGVARDRAIQILSNGNAVNTVELSYLSITDGLVSPIDSGAGICIDCGENDATAYQPLAINNQSVAEEIGDTTSGFEPSDINTSVLGSGSQALPIRSVVTLRNVDIYNNRNVGGGAGSGIMNSGILTIENSFIRNNGNSFYFGFDFGLNSTESTSGGMGGGIANWGGKITILNSIFSGNASQTGGAIYSQPILTQFRDEQVFIQGSQFTENRALMGGAIFNVTGDWNFPSREFLDYGVIVKDSTLENNWAYFLGGAIYTIGLSALQLDNVTVSGNYATSIGGPFRDLSNKGGAIFHGGKILDIRSSEFTLNWAANSIVQGGGALSEEYIDQLTGGDDVFLDVIEASTDPESTLPWRFSLLNTIIGTAEGTDITDACFGTLGFVDFIVNVGGNTDDSNTCVPAGTPISPLSARSGKAMTSKSSSEPTVLGPLTNNGGIPGNELPDGTFPPTHELISGSAIGGGIDCEGRHDQRGFGRDSESCDAGPFQTGGNTKGVSGEGNRFPIARDDYFLVPADEEVMIRLPLLLQNDTGSLSRGAVQLDRDSVQLIDHNGSTVRVDSGSGSNTSLIDYVYFTPMPGFLGSTRFSYTVSVIDDTTGESIRSEAATVTIETTDSNFPPIAYSQSFFIAPGDTMSANLFGELVDYNKLTAFDPEKTELQYEVDLVPQFGEVAINSDGTFSYTADVDAQSSDGFTYRVIDADGMKSQPATVKINFIISDISSMASPSVSVAAGKVVNVDLRGGMPGDLSFNLSQQIIAKQGEVIWLNEKTGELLYRAAEDAKETDQFSFRVYDLQATGDPNQTSIFNGVVDVAISAPVSNSQPVAVTHVFDIGIAEEGNVFSVNAYDEDGDILIFNTIDEPEKGTVTWNGPVLGAFIYASSSYSTGSDSFTYSVSDGIEESLPALVTINLLDKVIAAPVANDDTALTASDVGISVNVVKNDILADGGELTVVLLNGSRSEQGGRASISARGMLRYTPPANYVGEDIVTYQIDNGQGGTDSARLKVTVVEASFNSYQDQITRVDDDITTSGANQNSNDGRASNSNTGGAVSWLLILVMFGLFRRAFVFTGKFSIVRRSISNQK